MKKILNLVIIPTNKKAGPISIGNKSGIAEYHIFQHEKSGIYNNHTFYHLYILSDEEIKEGWFIHGKKLYNRIKRSGLESTVKIKIFEDFEHAEQFGYKDTWVEVYKSDCKKIIATTNETFYEGRLCLFPKPSQSFIEHFVKEYNKGNVITEVEVEYEIGNISESYFDGEREKLPLKLKINFDNTINIVSTKTSWSRKEHIDDIKRILNLYATTYIDGSIDSFIENNL